MRVFVATMLGGDAQRWCHAGLDELLGQHRDVLRPVPAGTLHLTHFFCDDLCDVPVESVAGAVAATAAAWPAFRIRLGGLRTLPPGPRPRLISLEVPAGGPRLAQLASALAASVRRAHPALAIDPARSAHVTLARFRKHAGGRDARAVGRELDGVSRQMGVRDEPIDRIELVRSTLTDAGPAYETLSRAALSGTDA
ncbi:MAG: hypothetical protein IT184_16020 [Acidobacteria bacterium]|nr:hypothetical protein [Acidobacteriota bacterium]